jgi:hypothetical protein
MKNQATKTSAQREGEHESRLRESVARKDFDQDVSDAFTWKTARILREYDELRFLSARNEKLQK